jgi:hypothetical protein
MVRLPVLYRGGIGASTRVEEGLMLRFPPPALLHVRGNVECQTLDPGAGCGELQVRGRER